MELILLCVGLMFTIAVGSFVLPMIRKLNNDE